MPRLVRAYSPKEEKIGTRRGTATVTGDGASSASSSKSGAVIFQERLQGTMTGVGGVRPRQILE